MSNYEFWDELGKIFNAVVAYQEKSIEFNKRFINPWIRLGNVFDKQDRHREAVNAYQKAVEIDPDNAQNWCDLGNAYFRTEAYDQAVDAFEKAIELNPGFGWPYSNLALIYGTRGDHEQAVLLYKKSIDLLQEDKDKAVSWNRLGNLYRKLNEYDLAVQAFQKADELDHENAGFRDELDDVTEKIPTSGSNVVEGQDQPADQLASPIELIVEENRIEDATLAAATDELVPNFEDEEDLSGEAGEELSDAMQESLPEVVVAVEAPVTEAPVGEHGNPVQSLDQMGKLPQELVLEAVVEQPVAASDGENQQTDVQASDSGAVAAGEIVIEPVVVADETSSSEAPEPVAEPELESPITVQDVVETFTESLIVADTVTETSNMSSELDEARAEAPAVVDEPALIAVELAAEATSGETTPSDTTESLEIAGESEVALMGSEDSGEAAAEASEPAGTPEAVESMEMTPEMVSEGAETTETAQDAGTGTVEAVGVAQDAGTEVVETVTEEQDAASEADEPVESAPEIPVAVVEAPVEAPVDAQPVASQEEIAPEPAVIDTDQPAEVPGSEATTVAEASAEAAVPAEPAVEVALPEAIAEETNNEVEGLQHAAYEEFLKEDGKVLNAVPGSQEEEAVLVPASTVSAEPATKIDASGEIQIAMDTKNAHVWNELGNVYFNNGSIDDSIVAYSKAIELDRWFAWPYSNLALAYVQKGRFPEAVLLYQRSIELFQNEKDKAVSWNRLGNVYRRMNDYEGAIAAYQRADELDPDNTTLSLQSRFSLLGSFQMEQNATAVA